MHPREPELSLAVRPRRHRRVIWGEERAREHARMDLMGVQEQNADRLRCRTGPRVGLLARTARGAVSDSSITR